MRRLNKRGFTLIELLLVVVVMGLMLAVIVPRAWRANIDAKYGNIRQDCSELASFAMQWAEGQLAAQDQTSTARLVTYLSTLTNGVTGEWVADTANSNWNKTGHTAAAPAITGRLVSGVAKTAETSVEGLIAPEKIPRNPFNGASVFLSQNLPSGVLVVPGAIACGSAVDASQTGTWNYFALVFQGTDSTTTTFAAATPPTTFHAGQEAVTLAGLRNGIFMARIQQ